MGGGAGAAGRWLFDWLTLVTALAAVGQHPRPTLILLAFCAAQLLAQIPITPGGLGVVEAGLTGFLVVIGVPASAAAVATLAYRLVSYWLALPAGGIAYLVHRRKVAAGNVSVPRPRRPADGGYPRSQLQVADRTLRNDATSFSPPCACRPMEPTSPRELESGSFGRPGTGRPAGSRTR